MAKKSNNTIYRCQACGHEDAKWLGRCPGCGEWNTFREVERSESRALESFPLPLSSIDPDQGARFSAGMGEFDRVLGGGLVPASTILISGEPGIGKSTLLLQACAKAKVKGRVLYVSGEESAAQIRQRADRTSSLREGLEVLCATDLALVMRALEALKPALVVVDSLQTLHAEEAGAVPGTVNQVKYCGQELAAWAKTRGACLFLVAHVTKDGSVAGPKAAEHMVDAVLGFEQAEGDLRLLRASKNRFGSVDEIGLFRMSGHGLAELPDAGSAFIPRRDGPMPAGVAIAPVYEGSRVLLVEIQALTVEAKAGITRVYSDRIDSQRVSRVAAVLERQTGLRFSDQDLYVNVAGGIRLTEPGIDLALACALYSARSTLPLPKGSAQAGELSLAGELRPAARMGARAKAARGMGFGLFVGPEDPERGATDWKASASLKEAVAALFPSRS